jgi:hypothetical protein
MRGYIHYTYTLLQQEVVNGFLVPRLPLSPGMILFPPSEKIVGRLPINLSETQLVCLPTCGGFCDRFISFLGSSRSPCHPSQFQVFLISSVSLSSLF